MRRTVYSCQYIDDTTSSLKMVALGGTTVGVYDSVAVTFTRGESTDTTSFISKPAEPITLDSAYSSQFGDDFVKSITIGADISTYSFMLYDVTKEQIRDMYTRYCAKD